MTEIDHTHEGHDDAHAPGSEVATKVGYSPVADIPHKPRVTDTDP